MRLQGIGVSPGITIGAAYVVTEPIVDVTKKSAGPDEAARLSLAIGKLAAALSQKAAAASGTQADILESHVILLSDPEISSEIEAMIQGEHCNCEYAAETVFEKYAEIFHQSGDELMMMRAGDMRDIKNGLLAILSGYELPDLGAIPKGSILAANELTTSLAAGIDETMVSGFVTGVGGPTSHMAIIARSMGLPAVAGVNRIEHGDRLIVNGDIGEVIVKPTDEELAQYSRLIEQRRIKKEALEKYKGMPSVTRDGRTVELFVNIGLASDIDKAAESEAEGVGLFRTEFLYMNRNTAPTEEEQFAVYKKAALAFQGRPVIIRTLDIGGDKEIPYLGLEKEENPFLGWRAIRYCIDREEIFSAQIKAILRASAFGSVKIMLPMISDIREVRYVKSLIEKCKAELAMQAVAFDRGIAVGIMIETPAAAVMAGAFAKEADFFSIGTNDLTQYVMAADRGNQKVARLYSVYNPAVLSLVYHVAKEARRNKIHCGICGEAGADPVLTKFFIGCGISELSMAYSSILEVRSIIRQTAYADLEATIAGSISQLASVDDSLAMLRGL